ncbi:hypothetical protein D3C76_753960 [compost metagenome]
MADFKEDAKLETGQYQVPVEVRHRTRTTGAIVGDQFFAAAKAVPRVHFDCAGASTIGTGPGDHQPGQVEQRVADGRQFPIDDCRQLPTAGLEHHVGEVKVTVLDAGLKLLRAMLVQPVGQAFEARQTTRTRPTRVVFDAVQLSQPT